MSIVKRIAVFIPLLGVTTAGAADYLPLEGTSYEYALAFHELDAVSVETVYREIAPAGYEPDRWGPPADGPLYVFDDLTRQVMYMFVRHDGDGLQFLDFLNNLGEWRELTERLELPLEAGTAWSGDGWAAEVTAAGTVTTPAGEFADCLLLCFTYDGDGDDFTPQWKLYLAPDVGPVAETRRLTADRGYEALLSDYDRHDD